MDEKAFDRATSILGILDALSDDQQEALFESVDARLAKKKKHCIIQA